LFNVEINTVHFVMLLTADLECLLYCMKCAEPLNDAVF